MIYWDYNATAPLRPKVKEKVIAALDRFPGNASSPHALGQSTKAYIESVRRRLTDYLSLKPTDLVFCGSATEANMMALWGHWFFEKQKAKSEGRKPGKLLVSKLEHSSVEKNVQFLCENEDVECTDLPLTNEGLADLPAIEKLLKAEKFWLVCLHAASNETGVIQPWRELAELCKEYKTPFHSDLVQIFGRENLDLGNTALSCGTLAFHKSGGLKGMGALILRHPEWSSVIVGGSQEKQRRAGTENILGVASVDGLMDELDEMVKKYQGPVRELRDEFESRLLKRIPTAKVVGKDLKRLPNTSFCVFPGVASDLMLMSLDVADICASAGSACSSGLAVPSTKLKYLGYTEEEAGSAIRFSLGESSKSEDIDPIISVIEKTIRRVAA